VSANRRSEPVGLLHSPVPPGFEVRVSAIPAGGARPVADGEWRDTLVEIEHGEVDVHLARGDHLIFGAGDVLWLDRLGVRTMRNRGPGVAVLVAIRRCSQG
jgi:hypothetical protein